MFLQGIWVRNSLLWGEPRRGEGRSDVRRRHCVCSSKGIIIVIVALSMKQVCSSTMKSEPVSNQLLHGIGFIKWKNTDHLCWVYLATNYQEEEEKYRTIFFEGNISSDSRKYETIAKCFEMPRIEMTQHYNSIECCHYRYDSIKQKFVASLGLVLPVPCLKWVGLNFFPPSLIVSFVLASGFKFVTKPCNSLYSPILAVLTVSQS